MNYNTAFVIAARSAEAHNSIQRWIASEAPKYEQRIKRTALQGAIACLEFTIACFDWAQSQIERSPEYALMLKLAKIRTYRRAVRMAIRLESARLAIAPKLTAAMDKVFALS